MSINSLFPQKTENGLVHLVDLTGRILTYEEWNSLKNEVDKFYSFASDNDIENFNEFRELPMHSGETRPEPTFTIPQHLTGLKRFTRIRGWVYWLTARERLGTKIGQTSKNLRQRIKGNAKELQQPVTVIDAFQTQYPLELEQYLHKHFKEQHKHIKGDWFHLTQTDVQDLKILAYHFENAREVTPCQ